MGVKKTNHKSVVQAEADYQRTVNTLFELFKPYFKQQGKVELFNNELSQEAAYALISLVQNLIAIADNPKAKYFGADTIIAHQIIITNNTMHFWGKIYWLETHSDYIVNQSGRDPMFATFTLQQDAIAVQAIKFGDYSATNIDKVWWFDMELDWIYEFEA